MPKLGYQGGTVVPGYGALTTANSLNQRASISIHMTEDGWFYQMSGRVGRRADEIPRVAFAVWSVGVNVAPDVLVGRTDEFTTGTYMLDGADGTTYTKPLQTSAKGRSGKRYAFGFNANDADFGYGLLPFTHSTFPATEIGDEYRRTVPVGPTPQDPFGATASIDDRGWIAIWLDYETNVAPNVVSGTTPSAGVSVSGLTPTFAGDFRDDNETLPNGLPADKLTSVQIQVRLVGTTSLLMNYTYDAGASEQANRRFSQIYNGTVLVTGNTYEWRSRVADQFGAWSTYTGWTSFTPASGYVTNDTGTPSGKQETRSPGPFVAEWNHTGGVNAEAVQVEIVAAATGAVVKSSSFNVLGSPVVPGGTLSVTYATLGFTPLDWGGQYAWRMRVEDVNAITSNWSNQRAFNINAAPTIPMLIAPLNGAVVSSRPELVATSTDADADDLPGAGHLVSARIKDAAGNVMFTRTMSYDAVTQRFRYQTTSTDLATTGVYRWDAYAFDGTVYSSGNLTLGASAISTESEFTYSVGPAITHVAPALDGTVNTDTPLYDWTTASQERFRVRIYQLFEDESVGFIYDTGERTDSQTLHRQPAGYLNNGERYFRIIDVWNASNQQGTSSAAFFTVNYSSATAINNFAASPHRSRYDVTPTAVLLSWDQTEYTSGQFQHYVITRRAVADTEFDVDDEIQAENKRIAVISNPAQVRYIDYLPGSGITYVYGIKQIVELNDVTVASPITHAEMTVTFQETVICDARRGGARRVVLQAREDRTTEYQRDEVVLNPWGTTKPVYLSTNRWNRVISGTFYIVADTPEDAEGVVREFEKLHQAGGPHCYRDGRGRRYFGTLKGIPRRLDPPGGKAQRITFEFLQTDAREVFDT
jgi:hypothetical protein